MAAWQYSARVYFCTLSLDTGACIGCKFVQQLALLAKSHTFGHQVVPLTLSHCLGLTSLISIGFNSIFISQSHVNLISKRCVSDVHTLVLWIRPQLYLDPIEKDIFSQADHFFYWVIANLQYLVEWGLGWGSPIWGTGTPPPSSDHCEICGNIYCLMIKDKFGYIVFICD